MELSIFNVNVNIHPHTHTYIYAKHVLVLSKGHLMQTLLCSCVLEARMKTCQKAEGDFLIKCL